MHAWTWTHDAVIMILIYKKFKSYVDNNMHISGFWTTASCLGLEAPLPSLAVTWLAVLVTWWEALVTWLVGAAWGTSIPCRWTQHSGFSGVYSSLLVSMHAMCMVTVTGISVWTLTWPPYLVHTLLTWTLSSCSPHTNLSLHAAFSLCTWISVKCVCVCVCTCI